MEMTALKLALLGAGAESESALVRLHGELEHFLDRPLASDDIEAALAELAAFELVTVRVAGFVTTDAGRAVMTAQWEEFFPA